jgi:hypothetical protein
MENQSAGSIWESAKNMAKDAKEVIFGKDSNKDMKKDNDYNKKDDFNKKI